MFNYGASRRDVSLGINLCLFIHSVYKRTPFRRLRPGGPAFSLNHFVGQDQNLRRDGETNCVGGLEIDNELEFFRRFHR